MVKKSDGCTFGLVLQEKAKSMEKSIEEGFLNIKAELKKIDTKQIELFNHQSSRVPLEVVGQMKTQWRIITILTGLLCVTLGIAGTFFVAMIKFGGA